MHEQGGLRGSMRDPIRTAAASGREQAPPQLPAAGHNTPTSLANIICRFVRGSGIRNWRLSLNTAYEFQ